MTLTALSSLSVAADGGAALQNLETTTTTFSELIPLGWPAETVAIFVFTFVLSLIIDLLQHRNATQITFKGSVLWSLFWIALSLAFYGWVYWKHGPDYASLYLTGYVLEKTLSVDNLMVFIAIFKYFNIKDVLQHRILYYGILGAIIFRAVFVGLGSLLMMFSGYAEIIFGIMVAYAAFMMLNDNADDEAEEVNYENMWLVNFFQRFYPIFPSLFGKRFFINRKEADELAAKDSSITVDERVSRWMTPAFVCLLVIEGSDILFAVDSVPAVIAVTREPLLVYSSMIFAILGLRSLYFVLVVLTKYLVHLEKAVVFVLFFISLKMFLHAYEVFAGYTPVHITPNMSMAVVLVLLTLGVMASVVFPEQDEKDKAD